MGFYVTSRSRAGSPALGVTSRARASPGRTPPPPSGKAPQRQVRGALAPFLLDTDN